MASSLNLNLNLHSPHSLSRSSTHSLSLSPHIMHSSSLSFRFSPAFTNNPLSTIGSTSLKAVAGGGVEGAIGLTENAKKQLKAMRMEKNEDVRVRIGVKQGGCSGLRYTMEFEGKERSKPGDCAIQYDGFLIVCDSESLAILKGVQLDYNHTPLGGGFRFENPMATPSCGCGRSFCCKDIVDVASLQSSF